MAKIAKVIGRQILDSRGNPTVEVDVVLDDGFVARAAVPSGASTGEYEACELRDGDKKKYLGKGVTKAVENVNTRIAKRLKSKDPLDQRGLDEAMIDLDGTPNKNSLGANAILGASMGICVAGAYVSGMPVWKYIGKLHKNKNFVLPTPMANIINGGKHADNMIDFQEFMIMPVGAPSYSEGLRWITEVFHTLKGILKKAKKATSVGDEGGFAPDLTNDQALEVVMEAIVGAGYKAGSQIAIALDCASSELFDEGKREGYKFWKSDPNKLYTADDMIAKYTEWCKKYPIVSIEDGLDQNDWDGYVKFTKAMGKKLQIVGDDFRHQYRAPSAGHRDERRQCDPHQGEPDRHRHRNPGLHQDGAKGRLRRDLLAPLGGDRGLVHLRPRRGNRRGPDQDRQPFAHRPRREVQPTAPH